MADIRIIQQHSMTHSNAKAAAQQVAEQMARDYKLASEWIGDVLRFNSSGVSGSLKVLEQEAHLEISLGFFFKAFAMAIEEKVSAKMKKVFAAVPD